MAIMRRDVDPGAAQAKADLKANKKAERQRVRAEAAVAAEEAARVRQAAAEEAAFRASPQGEARTAYELGLQFFQVELSLAETQRTFSGIMSGDKSTKRKAADHTGLLELIESEGWGLQNVGYVWEQTGSVSRDKLLSTGQVAAVTGQVIGVYLFRRRV